MKGARKSKRAEKKKAWEARERYLETLTADRRYLVELDDLMERMWKERHSIGVHVGVHLDKVSIERMDWEKKAWPLDEMLEALERHREKVRNEVYWRPDIELLLKPKSPRTHKVSLVPLTEAQHKEWEDATRMEQGLFNLHRYLFGTWFNKKREGSTRGRPPDRVVEFRSQRIAAYTQFREWEGHPPKAAIADAVARYKCSRATVFEARKQWCPQMQHLRPHFDRATAKEYRERIEQWEDLTKGIPRKN